MGFLLALLVLALLALLPLLVPALLSRGLSAEGHAWTRRERRWTLALAVLLVLAASAVYRQVGSAPEVVIHHELEALSPAGQVTQPEAWAALLQRIAARLPARPDNAGYLRLLAEDAASHDRWDEAAVHYGRLADLAGGDADVQAMALTARFMAAGRRIDVALQRDMETLLSLEPRQPSVRGMLGMAAFGAGDYRTAIGHWEFALQALPPADPVAAMLRDGVQRARQALGELPAAAAGAGLRVLIGIPPDLQAAPGTPVFVFLSQEGVRMPLAARRLQWADLPASVLLGEADLLAGQAWPVQGRVQVVARLAVGGVATGSGDDPEARSDWLDAASLPAQVDLTLSQPLKK